MGTCVYVRKRQMRPKSYKLLIQNTFTCVNARIRLSYATDPIWG
jgi:hypothetical protein